MSDEPTEADDEQPLSGISCPRCKGADWRVTTTRKMRGLVRYRTCKGCFLRVRTREKIEAVFRCQPPAAKAG